VEEEQRGEKRAGYGERLLGDLSRRLQADFGGGYSVDNLEWFRQPLQTPPALRSRVKGRIAARAEKHRPGRRLPISAFSFQNFSFSAWHMNPALHDNTWIGCGTSLLWDAAALIRRMPVVWCAQIGFQSAV
jgi:hypothetical protein